MKTKDARKISILLRYLQSQGSDHVCIKVMDWDMSDPCHISQCNKYRKSTKCTFFPLRARGTKETNFKNATG